MFHKITDPTTKRTFSIFSKNGKQLLKQYVKLYQKGGDFDDCVDDCWDTYRHRDPDNDEQNQIDFNRCVNDECADL